MKNILNPALRILLATNGIVLLAGAMFGPLYALFIEEVGGSLMDAGLSIGFFALAAGVTTILAGRYTDKAKEPELIVVAGYLLMGVGFFLYLVIDSIYALFAVQILIGFAEALYAPAFDALYSRHANPKRIGRAWGTWEGMFYFLSAIGAVVGGVIANYFGFAPLFVVMAFLCFGSALYIYLLPRKVL